MIRIRFLSTCGLALAALAAPLSAYAQAVVAQPSSDADLLSAEMRNLAANPRDLRALLSAAAISTRLDDTSAALAFYARADAVDPGNPRTLAGRAAVLVRPERPGEALRLFQQAEQRGLAMADYSSDRGFAYDLLGAPQLAQRDYRVALAHDGRDDETIRRYALSLGITGKPDEAMAALDPLLRRSDRAAWRARAFILAMNGDVAGAERISTSMMPGNMGAAMTPFFRRLATLSAADRAFAVHFGELSPTQARRADLQLAPPFPAYMPERAPVSVASAAPPPRIVSPPTNQGRDRRSRRERERDQLAATTAAARQAPEPQDPPLPAPPAFQPPPQAIVQQIPTPTPTPAPVRYAATPAAAPVRYAPAPAPAPAPVRTAPQPAPTPAPAPVRVASATIAAPVRFAPPQPEAGGDAGPTEAVAPATIAPAVARPAPAVTPAPAPVRVGAEDSALAAIINGITIPASELGVAPLPGESRAAAPAAAPATSIVAETSPAVRPTPKPAAKAETSKTPTAKPGATATDAKGKKTDTPKPKPKPPAEPSRIWVQVGIGADEKLLPSTWNKLVKANPAPFRGRSGWWTPLRATNRLLTGPFKTDDEAQAFVNMLKKAGVSAYSFTSEAGQKVTKLGAK